MGYVRREYRSILLLAIFLRKAVQCARLGIDVSMCGCIGQDSLGEDYLRQLEIERVTTTFMTRSVEKSTGVAVINVETTSGANTIVIVPGANENVLLRADEASHMQMVEHIKQARVIICQNEIPLESTLSAMQIAQSGGTLSIFNPAPASRSLLDVAVVSDIVCPNESELSTLTSLKTNTEEEIAIAANCLLELGCKVVIVTLGERGAYLATKTKKMFIRAEAVAAVDSTGAGDSFIGKETVLYRTSRLVIESYAHCWSYYSSCRHISIKYCEGKQSSSSCEKRTTLRHTFGAASRGPKIICSLSRHLGGVPPPCIFWICFQQKVGLRLCIR